MFAWAVTMGAGVTMGSCMSHLPFHAGGGRGPKSITWTPAMAKHNSRVGILHLDDRPCLFLFFKGFKNMLNNPFFLIGQWSAAFTWTVKPLTIRIIHFETN